MKKIIILFLIIILTGISCGKSTTPKVRSPKGGEVATVPTESSLGGTQPTPSIAEIQLLEAKIPELQTYVYKSANLRDPFIPVIGRGETTVKGEVKGAAREVNIGMLTLKGYVFSQKRKQALFKSVTDGSTYVLDKGKLIDDHGRIVPGVAGIVKPDKVVLISKNNVVKEFKLREESE